MGLFGLFRSIKREQWFICYSCLGLTNHDEVRSIFHSLDPKVKVLGRPLQKCPRCGDSNTKSFAELKAERQDSALWGLERTVKKHRRSMFEVANLVGSKV
jgi:hypothetical protein